MIGRLRGVLVEKDPPQAVIDVNGMGYEVNVSIQAFYRLSATGETVQLYTQFVVREDAYLLFGFATAGECATFRQLVKVSGIGTKTALSVLSAMNTDKLAQAAAKEDAKRLSPVPGIGKKTAEHMVLELCGKLVSAISGGPAALFVAANRTDDIISIPLALDYNGRETKAAVKRPSKGTGVGEGVRLALKNLLK